MEYGNTCISDGQTPLAIYEDDVTCYSDKEWVENNWTATGLVEPGPLSTGIPDPTDYENDSEYKGVWNRILGPSGDRTDIAIGVIEGEPSNRVYMCEKKGSSAAGLYKGILNTNIITWDERYNLPKTRISISDSQMEFEYLDCSFCLITNYKKGTWGGDCGALENSSIKLAVGLNNEDMGVATLNYVYIDDIPVPLTLLTSYVTQPDCDSPLSYVELGEPKHDGPYGKYYLVEVTFTTETFEGLLQQTHQQAFYKHYFQPGCNLYKVGMSPLGIYTLLKL
jgi:hypothetical protein